MPTPLEIVRATYEGSSEENGRNLLAALAPDAEWTEAAGFPYAGTYIGPENIIKNVHQRLAANGKATAPMSTTFTTPVTM